MLGYMFLGISNNLVAGIYIQKKTHHLPLNTFIGALVNVIANCALIPFIGIMGAALATLLSYAAMAVSLYIVAQRFYPVKYEFGRIFKIAVAAVAVFLLYYFVKPESFGLLWKAGLLVLFVVLMYWMDFFERSELSALSRYLTLQRAEKAQSVSSVSNGFSETK
jgi:O-antigen/teichoic acid export membrane protein